MKEVNMLKEKNLEILVNEYYDNQMNNSELLSYEARMAISKGIREYTNRKCFDNFKISNSIKLVKNRAVSRASKMTDKFEQNIYKTNLFVDFYSVIFKSFNKHLRNAFLHIKRYNS